MAQEAGRSTTGRRKPAGQSPGRWMARKPDAVRRMAERRGPQGLPESPRGSDGQAAAQARLQNERIEISSIGTGATGSPAVPSSSEDDEAERRRSAADGVRGFRAEAAHSAELASRAGESRTALEGGTLQGRSCLGLKSDSSGQEQDQEDDEDETQPPLG